LKKLQEDLGPSDIANKLRPVILTLGRVKGGWCFMRPVAELWPEVAMDYAEQVARPMDLGSIITRLDSSAYSSVLQALADIRLIFSNARSYNGDGPLTLVVQNMERVLERELIQVLSEASSPDLEDRLSDTLSAVSAQSFCYRIINLPSVENAVASGRWARLETLAKLSSKYEISGHQRFGCLRNMNDFQKRLRAEQPNVEAAEKRLRLQLKAIGVSRKGSSGCRDRHILTFPEPFEKIVMESQKSLPPTLSSDEKKFCEHLTSGGPLESDL